MKRFVPSVLWGFLLLLSSLKVLAESRQIAGVPQRASDILGMEVRNLADEKLGKVEDLIVNVGAGRTSYVILSSGGVFGLGDNLIVVPAQRFNYREHDKKLILNADKDLLKGAPGYDKTRLPDWNDENWSLTVEEYYDRHSRNIVPKDSRPDVTKVPTDKVAVKPVQKDTIEGQGSSDKDVLITRTIRKQLMESSLSTSAKNIQVFTRDGHVTLRGTVKTEPEREEAVARAKRVAGMENVTDRLEIAK